MPFEDDEKEENKKIGLNKVSSKKSIFDSKPKKPTREDFEKEVKIVHERKLTNKDKVTELAIKFLTMIKDKTLPQNKNPLQLDIEKEVLSEMIRLGEEINSDPNESESAGSLSWITILFKIILMQRDRLNLLEYNYDVLEKKINFK